MPPSPPNAQPRFVVALCHRNVPEAVLLEDLRRVADLLKCKKLSTSVYDDHGKFSSRTYANRFGGWSAAVAMVKLKPSHCFHGTEAMMVRDIRRVARRCAADRPRSGDYETHGKYSLQVMRRLFKNWTRATEAARLSPCRFRAADDRDLFENLQKVWETLGRQPKQRELDPPLSKFSIKRYTLRFGSFSNALLAFEHFKHPGDAAKVYAFSLPNPRPKKRKSSRHVNWRLRYRILTRDHFRCVACGQSPATDPGVKLQIDHIIPWHAGGETEETNLQTLCETCNGGKSDSLPAERCRQHKAQAPSA